MIDSSITEKRCTECFESKPLTEFYRQHGKPMAWCKNCVVARRNPSYIPTLKPCNPICPLLAKECTGCGESKPFNEFYKDPVTGNKRPRCRACMAHDRHEYAVRIKQQLSAAPISQNESPRECTKCHQIKPADQFYRSTDRPCGRQSACKACDNADGKVRREDPENAQYRRERAKTAEAKYREKQRGIPRTPAQKIQRSISALWTKYRLKRSDYERMVAEQKGVCAICGNPPNEGRILFVDHDHQTGAVRGLLCAPCNSILGRWRDSPEIARKAVDYLLHHQQLRLVVG